MSGSVHPILGVTGFGLLKYPLLFWNNMNFEMALKDQWYPLCGCGCGEKVLSRTAKFLPSHRSHLAKRIHILSCPFCRCGCGERVRFPWNKYIAGHNCKNHVVKKSIVDVSNFPLCACECGEHVKSATARFISGHNGRGLHRTEEQRKHISDGQPTKKERPFCKCDCGERVKGYNAIYLPNHQNRGRACTSYKAEKISKTMTGRKYSEERKRHVGDSLRGRKWTEEQKLELRKTRARMELEGRGVTGTKRSLEARINMKAAAMRRLQKEVEKFGKQLSWQGHVEAIFSTILQRNTPYKIKVNRIVGRAGVKDSAFAVLDGYIEELNLAIEFDEEYHSSKKQQEKDKTREIMIESQIPGICFWRVSIQRWKEDPKDVIGEFCYIQARLSQNKGLLEWDGFI